MITNDYRYPYIWIQRMIIGLISFSAAAFTVQAANETTAQNVPSALAATRQQALDEETARRRLWSLSQEEWTRYQTLMQGLRGSISPANISPIEVLGVHARDARERRKYAKIWARMRHDDAERVLAFQRAYNEAFRELYPNLKLIDASKLQFDQEGPAIAAGERVLVFLKTAKCPNCDSLAQRLLHDASLARNQIDFYFTDTRPKKDDDKIRRWAKKQEIDPKRVHAGTVTLNHDNGNLFKITRDPIGPVPKLFKIGANGLVAVNY